MAVGDKAAKAAGLVEVTIHRGTYITSEGEFGPKSVVKVDAEEAARLKSAGTVRPDDYVEPEVVQDGTLSITAGEGPTVQGLP